MYHLLVTAEAGAWDGRPYVFGASRVLLEYTDDALRARYQALREEVLGELLSLPALFAYEASEDCGARVGFITSIMQRSDEVRIEYGFFDLAPIPVDLLSKLSWQLEIGNLEMERTHWAVKSADLFEILLGAGLATREQTAQFSAQLAMVARDASSSVDNSVGMSPEDRRNSGLQLLLLLAQVYYRLLECSTSMADWCVALDLELNESYFWVIGNIRTLLENHEDLQDFPIQFEPFFPDLYPLTIKDIDWEDMVAPEAERFLSTVQRYVAGKGVYKPEKGSPAWVFIELFRPAVETAIQRAIGYRKRMEQVARTSSGDLSPQTVQEDKNSRVTGHPTRHEEEGEESAPRQKSVFISYSHKDAKHCDELKVHLRPLERIGTITVWSDKQIQPGSEWAEEIRKALASAKVAVLLVTKDFLASDFIQECELGPLLGEASEEGVRILWVLVRDCNWEKTSLKDYQAAYPTERALAAMRKGDRDSAWVEISKVIERAVR